MLVNLSARPRQIQMVKKLLVFLADPLKAFYEKGEVKPRYYNPDNLFSEVHFVSPATREIDTEKVQCLVGNARMVIHPVGPSYYFAGFLPFGRLAAVVKTIRPNMIRAYDPGLRGSLAVFWSKKLGVPSMISVHADLDDQRRHEKHPFHQARKLLEHFSLRKAGVVICVSQYLEPYAKKYGAKHVEVIYNKVYTEQFAGNRDRRDPQIQGKAGTTILSVGRLARPKYQECLIRAIQSLDVNLTLIGDGALRDHLKELVNQLQMEDRVEFIRAVPHREISRYYHATDIFAIATHYEGFCIPVLEAMAAGLPVVASRIGPIEEIVGDSGFLVENTFEAFAEVLEKLIKDPRLRTKMGEKASRRALAMDGHLMEKREKVLYQSLCG